MITFKLGVCEVPEKFKVGQEVIDWNGVVVVIKQMDKFKALIEYNDVKAKWVYLSEIRPYVK